MFDITVTTWTKAYGLRYIYAERLGDNRTYVFDTELFRYGYAPLHSRTPDNAVFGHGAAAWFVEMVVRDFLALRVRARMVQGIPVEEAQQ